MKTVSGIAHRGEEGAGLEVYKLAFETAMKIFEITKSFPA